MLVMPNIQAAPASDYGSDFDSDSEDIVNSLLKEVEAGPIQSLTIESLVEDNEGPIYQAHVPKNSRDKDGPNHSAVEARYADDQLVDGEQGESPDTVKFDLDVEGKAAIESRAAPLARFE